ALLGTTVQLPPNLDEKGRDRRIREGIDNPRFPISGARASEPDSPYGIEVLVKTRGEYQPRPAQLVDGLAFVPIKRDEVYAIKLINDTPHDAAVTLSIDGLNVFAFSEVKDPKTGRPRYTHFMVAARKKEGGETQGGEGTVA